MKKILKIAILATFMLTYSKGFSQSCKNSNSIIKPTNDNQKLDRVSGGFIPTQYFEVGGMQFISKSFTIKSKGQDINYLGAGQVKEVFFTFILLTDLLDSQREIHKAGFMSPKNKNTFQFNGSIRTRDQHINYLAKATCEKAYSAIINDQNFNLELGQTILIAPQKDKSLRFLQVKSPGLNSLTASDYVKKLLTKAEVVSFFQQEGNI